MASAIDPLLQKLNVRLIAPLLRTFGSFWSWWSGELIALLPAGMQEVFASSNKQVVCLPSEQVLVRALTLPIAAEENLREVLSFELDRQTPFTTEQACYDYIVKERNPTQGTITVELVVSPRTIVDELLETLAQTGITPDVITTLARDSEDTLPVNLLPVAARRRSRLSVPRLNTALSAACVALLLVALLLPPWLNKRQVAELELQQSAAEIVAKDGLELRRDVERLTAASEFLLNKKQSGVFVLQMLEEVTRVLPDDTWLTRFDVNGSELQLHGQSSSAAALIELFESSPLFHNARFRSPVVQVPRTDLERFHLSIELQTAESS